jgi:hypothetical protein
LGIELLLLKFVPSLDGVERIRAELIAPLRSECAAPLAAAV